MKEDEMDNSAPYIPGLPGILKMNMQGREIAENELSDLIINCLPGIFYIHDQEGRYLRWNKNFEIVSGYSKEEISTIHPLQFFDPEIHQEVIDATRRVYEEGYSEFEVEVIIKSGERRMYYLNGFPVIYQGKICLIGTGIDISAGHNAQKEIVQNEKKYRSLFEQASDPILVTDFEGNFSDVNGSFCKLFGYTRKELLKMNIKSLVCPYELKDRPLRNDLLMKGKHIFSERLMIHKDGSILETEANLKKFGDDQIMAIVRDVTEARKLQRELEQERLEQKVQEQKKITRAVIVAQERERNNIGRELHDNVNQLLASARMCLSTAKLTQAGKKGFVDKSIRLIDASIFEIRVLGKKHVTPLRGFDLKEQISSLIRIMEEGIGFKINMDYQMPDNSEISDDIKLNIYRIIQEQLNNVYKHASASRVQIKMHATEGIIYLSIVDNGIGFELGIKKNGVGIVNIVNRVESFNGKVDFETNPGVGCRLDIRIPMVISTNPS